MLTISKKHAFEMVREKGAIETKYRPIPNNWADITLHPCTQYWRKI